MIIQKSSVEHGRVKNFQVDVVRYQLLFDSEEERNQFRDSAPKWLLFYEENPYWLFQIGEQKIKWGGEPSSENDLKWKLNIRKNYNWRDGRGNPPDDYSLKVWGVKGEYQNALKIEKWLNKLEEENK